MFVDHTRHYFPGVVGYVVACDSSSHFTMVLTSAAANGSYLMPGSVSIRGHFLSYGFDLTIDTPDLPIFTLVGVINTSLKTPGVALTALAGPRDPNYPSNGFFGKVTATVVGGDGAMAWITCAGGKSVGSDLAFGRHALCQRPGRMAWVYTAKAPTGQGSTVVTTLLGEGRGIDPRSLRLVGSVVSWVDDGRRHTAALN